MKWRALILFLVVGWGALQATPQVELGVDVFFKEGRVAALKNKKIGLITNHTGVNGELRSTIMLFKEAAKEFSLVALFCPEHGLTGASYGAESIKHGKDEDGIPVYSLYGDTRRPTAEMLKGIDVLIFDMQETGVRAYTYASTLFYVMEEAAKSKISVIVLDRPNPMGGLLVDGPMLEPAWRSFLGYVNVAYCHGMTIGELALLFNSEYKVGCNLEVVSMRGWKREMIFKDTGLPWIPPSPNIPESDTPLYSATTGILGQLNVVNIGIGYTLPFKIVGAPWIHAKEFAEQLNSQKLPGVHFQPFYYRPFYGSYKGKNCEGVKILITDPTVYKPLAAQYLLMGILKTLYPKEIETRLATLSSADKKLFCQINGTEEVLTILREEKYAAWKLIGFQKEKRAAFLDVRQKYLLY